MYSTNQAEYVLSHVNDQTIDQLSKAIGKSRKSLFTFLRNHGITQETHPALCDVPLPQFISVTTTEVAYLLGFLWADGHVCAANNGIVVDCVKDDMDVLEPVFDRTGVWRKASMSRQGKRPSRVFRTYNPALCAYLGSCGYQSKATRSQEAILSTIPSHLHRFFWRGYFDGDGCIYISPRTTAKVSIAGSYDQDWTSFKRLAVQLGIPTQVTKRHDKRSRSSTIFVLGQHNILAFLRWIYQGFDTDRIGLKRKHDKYLAVEQHVSKRPLANTGYIGVIRVNSGRYIARLITGGKKAKVVHYLGTFDTAKEAAVAYDVEALKRRGNRARLNLPHQSSDLV